MSHYIEKVTVSLENLISELARNPSLFLKNPDTDFSRNRRNLILRHVLALP